MDEKEAHLRCAYGLRYPEPNITFALCRGSWTSPAVSEFLNPTGPLLKLQDDHSPFFGELLDFH